VSGVRRLEAAGSPFGLGDWLRFAATPTFAAMAAATGLLGDGRMDLLCGHASPLSGMVPMYLLMSAFHASPWLKLLLDRPDSTAVVKRGRPRLATDP
jgi:hypothetical protein